MSGLCVDDSCTVPQDATVDVREQGKSLRFATNTPHLVSLGTGRLSTAVTLHQVKQGRVTIGSSPSSDIRVQGTGVASNHCCIENSNGVVTLYPLDGATLVDGLLVDKAVRLSQGCMLTIGRSNYLRFNHPEEARLMKSVLPNSRVSMAPIQFSPNDEYQEVNWSATDMIHERPKLPLPHQTTELPNQGYQDLHLPKTGKNKPPVKPRKYKDAMDRSSVTSVSSTDSMNDSRDSQNRGKPSNSIMAKVSKFEYYAKSQNTGRSQFYTNENQDWSPKVFSSNSLTVNTPAKDVLGGKNAPSNYVSNENYVMNGNRNKKNIVFNENNAVDARNCSYSNVIVKSQVQKIDEIAKNFDERKEHMDFFQSKNLTRDPNVCGLPQENMVCSTGQSYGPSHTFDDMVCSTGQTYGASHTFDRNPDYGKSNFHGSEVRCLNAEAMREQAYQGRIRDEEEKEAENARLEEILNMCAEYERQITSGLPSTPTDKRPNKIITNGSLPRAGIVPTHDGYYKFDTSQNQARYRTNYENVDIPTSPRDDQTFQRKNPQNTLSEGDIGIPISDSQTQVQTRHFPITELSSPIMIRKIARNAQNSSSWNQNEYERNCSSGETGNSNYSMSPISSPYENMSYCNRSNTSTPYLKPKSPNTQSPRTRIKTSFAHRNPTSPQYFIFPTPPPIENDTKMFPNTENDGNNTKSIPEKEENFTVKRRDLNKCTGIERQLSLTEEIPMIDDSNITNDLEFRISQMASEKVEKNLDVLDPDNILGSEIAKFDAANNEFNNGKKFDEKVGEPPEIETIMEEKLNITPKNSVSLQNKCETSQIQRKDVTSSEQTLHTTKTTHSQTNSTETSDIKSKDVTESQKTSETVQVKSVREERRAVLTQIRELKSRMSEVRSQEDDILRELEMEKALIKGEYDSEMAILKLEQRRRSEMQRAAEDFQKRMERSKQQQARLQADLQQRVQVATLKLQRIEKDLSENSGTVEELRNAQDILENERKLFEDMEFQHLEEETDMLAYREELQNEMMALTKKIESQKTRIATLDSEVSRNVETALKDTSVLKTQYAQLKDEYDTLEKRLTSLEGAGLNETQSDSSEDENYDLAKNIKDKFNAVDQMSQSMIVELGQKRDISDLIDDITINKDESNARIDRETHDSSSSFSDSTPFDSPTKSDDSECSKSKEKRGFWERNFDSLSRRKNKMAKSPPKKIPDIMSQSLNENMFYNNENIESDAGSFEKFTNSLKLSRNKITKKQEEIKSKSASKIPTFSALGKIIKKDSFGKKLKEDVTVKASNKENIDKNPETKNARYVKNKSPNNVENKYQSKMGKTAQISTENSDKKSSEKRLSLHDTLDEDIARQFSKSFTEDNNKDRKSLHRKSYGDEPGFRLSSDENEFENIKIPSQDDIDRISKVTTDAPIFKQSDTNSLGRRTLDSLMEIERNRVAFLEQRGCQYIEDERERISELKRRVQNETTALWESERESRSEAVSTPLPNTEANVTDDSLDENLLNESSGLVSPSKEECRLSQAESMASSAFVDEPSSADSPSHPNHNHIARPVSEVSDNSVDVLSSVPRRVRKTSGNSSSNVSCVGAYSPRADLQRPLTRYLPIHNEDFNLKQHIESAGHQVELCPHITLTSTTCRGYLHKLGSKFHTWSKRWFVFDRDTKTFIYYTDKNEKKPRGGAYFQVIEEVYLDHANSSRSPNPQTTFVVKTRQRRYFLMGPSGPAARVWMDVIVTGAQGYTQYLQ